MIEITIPGLVGVIQKGGGVGVYRKGDRVEGTKENESYHVREGHAVYVDGGEETDPAGAEPAVTSKRRKRGSV